MTSPLPACICCDLGDCDYCADVTLSIRKAELDEVILTAARRARVTGDWSEVIAAVDTREEVGT